MSSNERIACARAWTASKLVSVNTMVLGPIGQAPDQHPHKARKVSRPAEDACTNHGQREAFYAQSSCYMKQVANDTVH